MTMRPGSVGGSSCLLRFVDVNEQYGRHVIEEMLTRLSSVQLACDLGVGPGHDLGLVRKHFPGAHLIGIDYIETYQRILQRHGIKLHCFDLERDELPMADDSVDLFIANLVLAHSTFYLMKKTSHYR